LGAGDASAGLAGLVEPAGMEDMGQAEAERSMGCKKTSGAAGVAAVNSDSHHTQNRHLDNYHTQKAAADELGHQSKRESSDRRPDTLPAQVERGYEWQGSRSECRAE